MGFGNSMNPFKNKNDIMGTGMQMLDDKQVQTPNPNNEANSSQLENTGNGFNMNFMQQAAPNNNFVPVNSPVGNKPMGNNSMNNGSVGSPMGNNSMNNGFVGNPMSAGPMGNNPMNNGSVSSPMSAGPMGNNPMNNGSVGSPMSVGSIGNNPMNNSPVGNPMNNSPVGNPMNNGSVGNPMNNSPVGNPMNSSSVGNPMNNNSVGNPMNNSPVGNPMNNSPVGNPMNSSPVGNPMNSSPVGNPMNSSPVGNPMNSSPVGNPMSAGPMGNSSIGRTMSTVPNSTIMNNTSMPIVQNENQMIGNSVEKQPKSFFKGLGEKKKGVQQQTIQSNIDLDEIDMSASNSAYLQEQKKNGKTKVKVVQNIVEGSKYKAIMSKSITQFIVITGDRRSGKTTTALNIAEHFGRGRVAVLYVDFDTVNRGSLLALNLEELANYAPSVQNGLVSVSNGFDLNRCVYRASNTSFDSLVAIYGVAVTDEMLKGVQMQLMQKAEEYNVVVIDCPIDKLYLLEDILHLSAVYCCMPTDMSGILSTYFSLNALNPDEDVLNKVDVQLTSKNLMYLYMRMLYIICQANNVKERDNYKVNSEYLSNLFSMSADAYDWSALKVAGYQDDIVQVLKAIV